MNKEEKEEYFKENHKLLWFFTLYHTNKDIFDEFVKEKNMSKEQIKEIIRLSIEFKSIFPEKFDELSKE